MLEGNVATRVTELIVNQLEAVDVDVEDRDLRVRPQRLESLPLLARVEN